MKKIIVILSLLLSIGTAYSGDKTEVEVKDDVVLVSGSPVFKFERTKSPMIPLMKDLFLETTEGKKLMFFQINEFKDPAGSDNSTFYYVITFLGSGSKTEVRWFMKINKLAEWLVSIKLIKEGKISDDDEQEFVLTNGTRFSQRRKELYGSSNTIIINNNEPTPRNGINLHIGN